MKRIAGLLAALALGLCGAAAWAQSGYPDKPIRILVGFSPGVAPDVTSRLFGDPSVGAYQAGGQTYFYIASLFIPSNQLQDDLALTRCTVVGSGATASLSCGQPIVAAASGQCVLHPPKSAGCSFLDKEFVAIDAARARLYISYTDFGVNFSPTDTFSNGQIEWRIRVDVVNGALVPEITKH